MKNNIYIFVSMLAVLLSGCQQPFVQDMDFAVNREELRFPKTEDKAYFIVYSRSSWTVDFETPVDWAMLSRTHGTGNQQVTVTCEANEAASRGVNIIITNEDGRTRTIYLSQESIISDWKKDDYVYKLKDQKVELLSKGTPVSVEVTTKIPESMFDGIKYIFEPAGAAEWIKEVNATPTRISCIVDDYEGTEDREAVVGVYFPKAEWDEMVVTAFLTISQSADARQILLEESYDLPSYGYEPVSIPVAIKWMVEYYNGSFSISFSDDSWLDVDNCSFDPETKSVRILPQWNRTEKERYTDMTCEFKDEDGNIISAAFTTLVQDTAINLSDGGKYANCYLIETTDARSYYIDAMKPDGTLPSENMSRAEILWQNVTCPLDRVLYEDGKVYFRTVEGKSGNAVIVVKDADGVICWSWHIWVVGEKLGTNTFNSTNSGVAPYIFMDRNLGATSKTGVNAAGLHYQYGRKDPFPSADPANYSASENQRRISVSPDNAITTEENQGGVTIEWAVQHPSIYVWGSAIDTGAEDWLSEQRPGLWGDGTTKSIYDPCPYGWIVPTKNAYRNSDWWDNMLPANTGEMTEGVGATCKDSNGDIANYLFSGRWRRAKSEYHLAHAGTHCYLWTSTESSGINSTDYKGTYHIRVRNNKGSLARGEESNQPRRWGANVRCIKTN